MFLKIRKTVEIVFWVFIFLPIALAICSPFVIFAYGYHEWLDRLRWDCWPRIVLHAKVLWLIWQSPH